MLPLIGLLAGAGLGLIKNEVEADKLKKEQKTAADLERLSPWTKVHPDQPVDNTNALGSALGGAGAGASMQQGIQDAGMRQAWSDKMMNSPQGYDVNAATQQGAASGAMVPMESQGSPDLRTWMAMAAMNQRK